VTKAEAEASALSSIKEEIKKVKETVACHDASADKQLADQAGSIEKIEKEIAALRGYWQETKDTVRHNGDVTQRHVSKLDRLWDSFRVLVSRVGDLEIMHAKLNTAVVKLTKRDKNAPDVSEDVEDAKQPEPLGTIETLVTCGKCGCEFVVDRMVVDGEVKPGFETAEAEPAERGVQFIAGDNHATLSCCLYCGYQQSYRALREDETDESPRGGFDLDLLHRKNRKRRRKDVLKTVAGCCILGLLGAGVICSVIAAFIVEANK
jgi:hypothetical protein